MFRFGQLHVAAGHQPLDVGQDQHAATHGAEAGDEARIERPAELRRRADLLRRERGHVGHGVDHDAEHAARESEDDLHGEFVVARLAQAELQAQVDDRHDDAAQVDHALDESGRVGDGGGVLPAADLLHFQDFDGVFLRAEAEGKELAALGLDGILHCGFQVAFSLTSCGTSRIRATLPSPMMVAAEMPGILRKLASRLLTTTCCWPISASTIRAARPPSASTITAISPRAARRRTGRYSSRTRRVLPCPATPCRSSAPTLRDSTTLASGST